jgi:predicted ATPase/Tfp pilus assembly protein PilF
MPRSIIDKRYKVLKRLGAGAMGAVYKVKDLKNDNIIALKLLSRKKTSSETVQRFKREFRLLAELHHPNLCEVYDFGTLKDGRNYFTMEYIEGENIFTASKGLSYEKLYGWVVQLCRALQYIHSKGLIHYDIKPGNVLIQYSESTTCVKLMDFGLAGEQQIKDGKLIRGTFPYIAPEVIKGLEIDHRADLYSFGILLYEIFTKKSLRVEGKESFATILEQRRKWFLELPSKIVTDIPEKLERMIVRLCSLQPAARFSRANEVIKEINKFTPTKFELETEKTVESYLLSSQFVGRDKEMNLLKSLYGQTRQGDGKVVLITGDAGIGKSRLLREFKTFTQMERSHTFIGYAYKDKIGPLELFHDIFSELINYVGNDSDLFRSRELRLSRAVLFKIFPDLKDNHLKRNLPKLVPLEPKQEKLRTFDALSELIKYIALDLGELVIFLEDLHWADDLSIQFLEYLGRNLRDRNIFICGTSRKEELKENLLFRKIITNLRNESYFTQVELRPLRFRNLYSFLDSTITSASNSSELVRYFMKKTGGNPFFVEEIMRILLQKRGVSIGKKMEVEDFKQISIPETIEEVVLKRIKDLDSTSREVVKFGAILLKDFNYDLMKHLTGLENAELSKALWKLKSRQILIEEDNRYRFYHATLREAVHRRLGDKERSDLNYQIGKTLEKINRRRLNTVVEDLAYYFINAKNKSKGVRYGIKAAKKSKERYANEQAIIFYKDVLDLLGNKDLKCRFNTLVKLAETKCLVGFHDDAIKTYSKALNMKIGTIKKIKIYSTIGGLYEHRGDYKNALYFYQKVKGLRKKIKSSKLNKLLEIHINVRICSVNQRLGNYNSVNKFNFDAVKFPKGSLKSREARELQAKIYNSMGNIEYQKTKYSKLNCDKAIIYFNEAYKYYKKIKDATGIVAVQTNLGLCYYMMVKFRKALNYYQKSIQMSEKTGNQYSVSLNLYNRGLIFEAIGCYSKALACFQKALFISKKIGNQRVEAASLKSHGVCFLKFCDYKNAREYFEKALKIFDAMSWVEQKAYSIWLLGNVYQATGDYSLSIKFYRKSLKILREIGRQGNFAKLCINISSIFINIGVFSVAKRYIEDALMIAEFIGGKDMEIECYVPLCRMSIMMKDYVTAVDYYEKGIKIAKKTGSRPQLLELFILVSEINYHRQKYSKGIKFANKAIKMAKEMGTKNLYAEALLNKAKHEIKRGIISKIDIIRFLDEAKTIAEEIGCPEILWKIYYEYSRFLQKNREYRKALQYYSQCIAVFKDVVSKIKIVSYKKSYLNRPDRQVAIRQPSLLLPEFEDYLRRD